eukprot:1159626-Pelagomonas_calceolata.AAC.7
MGGPRCVPTTTVHEDNELQWWKNMWPPMPDARCSACYQSGVGRKEGKKECHHIHSPELCFLAQCCLLLLLRSQKRHDINGSEVGYFHHVNHVSSMFEPWE